MADERVNSRGVTERIFISGRLELQTPAHFGNGDSGAKTDMPLLRDGFDVTRPLLTGASIAGALRNYLREYEKGYGIAEFQNGQLRAEQLFGHLRGNQGDENPASVESWLMVDDALGEAPDAGAWRVELRDGVAIDAKSRTAEINEKGKGFKYDIELLAAGTVFPLGFELWRNETNADLLESLALALKGLEEGRIGLGMRKRRGYGEVKVTGWRVWRYSLNTTAGLLGWLNHDPGQGGMSGDDILSLLEVTPTFKHQGTAFSVKAEFHLENSLLIRQEGGSSSADMAHLRSWRGEVERPILSGTSLAGVIRGRALRIANTLNQDKGETLVNEMFGRRIRHANDEASGSRVVVQETVIENGIEERIQNRVKLDRFTGGAYPQALFSQKPVWGKGSGEVTTVRVHLALRKPENGLPEQRFQASVGLLLLVLKDLWLTDLPLGGESSVGRGRVCGHCATLTLGDKTWTLTQEGEKLTVLGSSQTELEQFVVALHQELKP